MKFDFTGKIVLVTGGGAGIGRAICLEFADVGAKIACVDIDRASGDQTIALVRERGGDGIFVHADVTDSVSVHGYVQQTLAKYGRIDVFANNAGCEGAVLATTDYPEDVFDRVMAVNVKGVFLGLKYVLPVMTSQGSGVVVNTGSTGSHRGAVGVCAYTASKHAVLGLTRTAALEVAKYGIRVNAICPGGTKTRMLRSLVDQRRQVEDLSLNITPANGRAAEPQEIAAMVVFMASEYAAHMVGQSLIVDGGGLAG